MSQTDLTTTTEHVVRGMTCGGCVRRVTAAVTAVEGVDGVDVDVATGVVAVTGTAVDAEAVASAVTAAGYEVVR